MQPLDRRRPARVVGAAPVVAALDLGVARALGRMRERAAPRRVAARIERRRVGAPLGDGADADERGLAARRAAAGVVGHHRSTRALKSSAENAVRMRCL